MAGPWRNPTFNSTFLTSSRIGNLTASILAGHRLFVRDSPTRFDASLSAHFLFVESTLAPISLGLQITHYSAALAHTPASLCFLENLQQESRLRGAALAFWSDVRWVERRAAKGTTVRMLLLAYQAAMLSFWLPLAAVCPSFTHTVLQHGNDIVRQKYLAVCDGAPPGLQGDIADRLPAIVAFHKAAADKATCDPVSLIVLMLLMLLFKYK